MPQLDFTIWLSNAVVNWIFLATMLMYLNSPPSTIVSIAPKNDSTTMLASNKTWTWK